MTRKTSQRHQLLTTRGRICVEGRDHQRHETWQEEEEEEERGGGEDEAY